MVKCLKFKESLFKSADTEYILECQAFRERFGFYFLPAVRRFEPVTTVQEVRIMPLCYATPMRLQIWVDCSTQNTARYFEIIILVGVGQVSSLLK